MDLATILIWLASAFSGIGGGGEFSIERADCASPQTPAERPVC